MSKKFKTNVEKFILFNMTPKKANKEAQKLIRDFNIAEVALFIIKQKVDRQTSIHDDYKDLINECYKFLIAFVRNNEQN